MLFSPMSWTLVVVGAGIAAGAIARSPDLTLDEAVERVAANHPDLRVFEARRSLLAAEGELAGQAPVLRVAVDVENAFGTGRFAALDGAEVGLSLASVLERGGKRAARRTLVGRRAEALAVQREARRLDLLAEVARRYLDLAMAQARHAIAADDVGQRQATVAAARRRVDAGASPRSAALAADAALALARLEQDQEQARIEAAWRRLSLLWNDAGATTAVPRLLGDPLRLPAIPDPDVLARLIEDSPELRRFADERRIGEARLRLEQARRRPDLDWQVGLRRLQDDDEWAVFAGISLPLGSARRAGPAIRGAESELVALDIEREGADLALRATLVDAHGRYRAAELAVARYRDDILPGLQEAADAAGRAFRAGALSYLEWAQLLDQINQARSRQLLSAVEAQGALIEIQRLTAQPFVLPSPPEDER